MDLKKYFEFESEVIPKDLVMGLSETLLDDLYLGDTFDQFNAFFTLLNEYHYLEGIGALKETAHICYLISYYLFLPLTPPHSEELALVYAKKALHYNNIPEYEEWIEEVKRGN